MRIFLGVFDHYLHIFSPIKYLGTKLTQSCSSTYACLVAVFVRHALSTRPEQQTFRRAPSVTVSEKLTCLDKVALRQFFIVVPRSSPVGNIPPLLHIH